MTSLKILVQIIGLFILELISTIALGFVVDDYLPYYLSYHKYMSHINYHKWSGSEYSSIFLILFLLCQIALIKLFKTLYLKIDFKHAVIISVVIMSFLLVGIISLKGETVKASCMISFLIFLITALVTRNKHTKTINAKKTNSSHESK